MQVSLLWGCSKLNWFVFILFFFFCGHLYAAALEWQNPISQEAQFNSDTQHYLSDDSLVSLLAGTDEIQALFREHTAYHAKGVVLFMTDWHLASNTPQGVNFLRTELNHLGWTTYSITAPDPFELNATEAENNDSLFSAPQLPSISQQQFTDYNLILTSRFKALYQQALTHPGFIVLVVQGQSGAMLVDYLSKDASETLDTVVLLNGFLPDKQLNQQLNQQLAKLKAPVLDIYYRDSNRWVESQMSKRHALVRKNHKFNYRQRQLFGQRQSGQQNARLLKEVYGFLTKTGM